MTTKPNIFKISPKKLIQDAFFAWLLQWANISNAERNPQLNETAKDFARLLINQPPDFEIIKVNPKRQHKFIDILCEVNDEYIITIEDKTKTSAHSGQLDKYRKTVEDKYKDEKFKLFFIYLKTKNQCQTTLKNVEEKGYSVIDRKEILDVLNKRPVNNDFFNDFKDYLTEIEDKTNSFYKFENIKRRLRACERFYLELQKHINDPKAYWKRVNNPKGGFLAFVCYYHNYYMIDEKTNIFVHIEKSFNEFKIRLVIKICAWTICKNTLYELLKGIKPYAEKNGISIEKPEKFSPNTKKGKKIKSFTLAIVKDAFPVDNDGKLEFDKFLDTLKALEKTIKEYCEVCKTAGISV